MSENPDSTPGIWQNEEHGIVLAHITRYKITQSNKQIWVEFWTAHSSGNTPTLMNDDARSFLRALNLYWETRS